MTQSDLLYLGLAAGGVLLLAAVLVVGLLAMTIWLERKTRRQAAEIHAAWGAFGQSLGLAVEAKGRQPPRLAGTHRGRTLAITGHYGRRHDPGHTWVTFQTDFAADVYLRKSRGGNLGVEYLPSGDAELDRRFVFQSRPPGLLARAVADPAVRRALAATDAWLNLDPRSASSHLSAVISDPAELRRMVEQAAEAAEFVQREIGVSIPPGRPASPETYADPFTPSLRLRVPRWALWAILVFGLLALAACVCAALWPAAGEVLKALQGA